jgi:UDP-glucose 6-dehydrogenase
VLPGTTESIQKENPDLFVLFSPEFLLEVTAKEDAANPIMNVIGIPEDTKEYREKAEEVLNVLPKSPHTQVCGAKEAEIIKYTHNCRAYGKIIFSNLFYDLSNALGCNWEDIEKAMDADPMFSNWYNKPVHKGGRGAGGHCFVKDFAAFRAFYEKNTNDDIGVDLLKEFEEKNKELLIASKKNPELLKEVYGIGE